MKRIFRFLTIIVATLGAISVSQRLFNFELIELFTEILFFYRSVIREISLVFNSIPFFLDIPQWGLEAFSIYAFLFGMCLRCDLELGVWYQWQGDEFFQFFEKTFAFSKRLTAAVYRFESKLGFIYYALRASSLVSLWSIYPLRLTDDLLFREYGNNWEWGTRPSFIRGPHSFPKRWLRFANIWVRTQTDSNVKADVKLYWSITSREEAIIENNLVDTAEHLIVLQLYEDFNIRSAIQETDIYLLDYAGKYLRGFLAMLSIPLILFLFYVVNAANLN